MEKSFDKFLANFQNFRSNRASEAVAALQTLHQMKKRGPKPNSLFLGQILKSCGQSDMGSSSKWSQIFAKSVQERSSVVVQDSKVLEKSALEWNWELVGAILKYPGENFMETAANRQFVRRVTEFLKPSSTKGFSKLELQSRRTKLIAQTGCSLLEFLLKDTNVNCKS